MNGKRIPSDLDTAFVECRGPLRHAWWPCNPPQPREGSVFARPGLLLVSKFCERCGKMCHEAWNKRTGVLESRRYVDPPGYATISREFRGDDLRKEVMRRWAASPPKLLNHNYDEEA